MSVINLKCNKKEKILQFIIYYSFYISMISNQCNYKCDIHRKYLKMIINYITKYTHVCTHIAIFMLYYFFLTDDTYMKIIYKLIINYYLLNILYKLLFFITLNI